MVSPDQKRQIVIFSVALVIETENLAGQGSTKQQIRNFQRNH